MKKEKDNGEYVCGERVEAGKRRETKREAGRWSKAQIIRTS